MSSNQRPTKVRVFSSQNGEAGYGRRRGDAPVESETSPIPETAPAPTTQKSVSRGPSVMMILLFLLGCAVGGAALTWLGLGASL